ncbi:unnamed protein product [Camellia sinensis]
MSCENLRRFRGSLNVSKFIREVNFAFLVIFLDPEIKPNAHSHNLLSRLPSSPSSHNNNNNNTAFHSLQSLARNIRKMHKDHSGSAPSTPRIRHRRRSNEIPSELNKLNGGHLLVNDHNKYRSMWIRAYSTLWMLAGFAFILYLGHLYMWAMVVVIQIFMARELFNLLRRAHEDTRLPGFRLLNWFLLPALLIAINDVAAYIFGFFFGKTPLIKLSPKKTWEGFIGASVATMISAFVLANILGRFQWLTCPRNDLSTGWLQCDPGPLFKPEYYSLAGWVPQWFPWKEISILPVQWHALCLGLFASIIAPFGGFFASGFKRAFKIKDFGDSIPGHGGFTDRMDCQMVMAVFAYIYHQSFVIPQSYPVEVLLDQDIKEPYFRGAESTIHEAWGDISGEASCMQKLHQDQAICLQKETLYALLICPTQGLENRSSFRLLRREHRWPQNGFLLDHFVIFIHPDPSQTSPVHDQGILLDHFVIFIHPDPSQTSPVHDQGSRLIDDDTLLLIVYKGRGNILQNNLFSNELVSNITRVGYVMRNIRKM